MPNFHYFVTKTLLMNSIKKWIRDVFGFSGNEVNGFLILIPIMLLLIMSESIYSTLITNKMSENEEDAAILDSLAARWDNTTDSANGNSLASGQVPLFFFDPNIATLEQFRSLGISQISANRIAAYRRKGGNFKIKSDLMKIYGLDSALYKKLYPYIQLPSESISLQSGRNKTFQPSKLKFLKRKSVNQTFDINTADTIILKTIYGIGSRLAARIVKFRDGLGGFIKPEQLYEVYGLDSTVVNRLIKVSFVKEGFIPVKININTADEKQLSTHPYARFKIARALMTYRFQHGDFLDVQDIKKLSIITPEEAERFLPYIKVKD